jgi:uncharacterized delta-60 repeat protein
MNTLQPSSLCFREMLSPAAASRAAACSIVVGLAAILLAAVCASPVAAAPPGLDPSFGGFGTGGKVVTPGLSTIDWVHAEVGKPLTIDTEGRIVVAGARGRSVAVARFLPDGARDDSFGQSGMALLSSDLFAVRANAVQVQEDGRVVVAGVIDGARKSFLVGRLTAAGQPDASFGTQGLVATDLDNDEAHAAAIALQPDGKIVVAGRAKVGGDFDFAVARYLADGRLDPNFGEGGRQSVGFGGREECTAMALLPDGKLLLVGVTDDGFFPDADFAIVRLNTDGSLDESFDGDGKISTGFGDYEEADACFVQPDGRFVVVGYGGDHFAIARYLPNGELDATLDGDGKAHSQESLSPFAVAVQLDGKIVVAGNRAPPGNTNRQLVISRLRQDGSPDPELAGTGSLSLDFSDQATANAVEILSDGRLLVSGQSGADHLLIRLLPDGTLDDNGRQLLAFEDAIAGPAADERAYALAADAEGRPVLAGEITNREGSESAFALARFTVGGAADATFGDRGRVRFGFVQRQGARAIALQPDGKIVAAGYARGANKNDFMVARFTPAGEPDPSFAFFSASVADFAGGDDEGNAVAIAPDGKIVVAGDAWDGAHFVFAAARFTPSGAADSSFSGDGKATANLGLEEQRVNAVAVAPNGSVLAAGTWNGDFAIFRWNADGSVNRGALIVTDLGQLDGVGAIAIAPDGSIVAAGYSSPPRSRSPALGLARYSPAGALDATFGAGGKVRNLGPAGAALAVAVRSDGRIATAGCSGDLFNVVQLTREGALDSEFAGAGIASVDFGGSFQCATGVAFVGTNKIIAGGYQVAGGNMNFAVARFLTSEGACEGPGCGLGGRQLPSDANQDAKLDISDAVWILGHLFGGTNPSLPCDGGTASSPGPGARALLDANGDGGIDISDAVRVLSYLFVGSAPPVLGEECTPIVGCPSRC